MKEIDRSGALESKPTFWATQNETGAVRRFLSRIGDSVVFADHGFSDIASSFEGISNVHLITFDPLQEELNFGKFSSKLRGRQIFLFCIERYLIHAAALQELAFNQGAKFYDWPHEVFPSFIGHNDSWSTPKEQLVSPERHFVLISTARSGSTYLGDLTQRNGFGIPKEHVRAPFRELLRYRLEFGLDLNRLSSRIMCACSRNGYFGTKVISGFLWPVLDQLSDYEILALFGSWWTGPVIYLVRESKVEQSVSDIIANATRTWHVRSEDDQRKYDEALKALSFDFDAINQRFLKYIDDEIHLREFVSRLPCVTKLTYADLVAKPERELKRVLQAIGGSDVPESITTATELSKTTSSKHKEFVSRFIREARMRRIYVDMLNDPLYSELK